MTSHGSTKIVHKNDDVAASRRRLNPGETKISLAYKADGVTLSKQSEALFHLHNVATTIVYR